MKQPEVEPYKTTTIMKKINKTKPTLLLAAALVCLLAAGCERESSLTLKGEIVAILDPCIGNEIIVSVSNRPSIGAFSDGGGLSHFVVEGDTLFAYDNVIAIPLQYDENGQLRYSMENDSLPIMEQGDIVEFECRRASEADTSQFIYSGICSAIYGPPSNIDRYVVTEITFLNKVQP